MLISLLLLLVISIAIPIAAAAANRIVIATTVEYLVCTIVDSRGILAVFLLPLNERRVGLMFSP